MRAVAAWLAFTVAAGIAAPAGAEHEVYYRYTVLGYVKDAKGRPVAGQSVTLVREKTGLAYAAETDAAGFYAVVARLGDETLGEPLSLAIGDARIRLTVRFDATDRTEERGTRVDLDGARWQERAAWFSSTRARVLAPAR
jgi:hypothetical protein